MKRNENTKSSSVPFYSIRLILLSGLAAIVAACHVQDPGPDKIDFHISGTVRNVIDGARMEGVEMQFLGMKEFDYSGERTIATTHTGHRGAYRFGVTVSNPDCSKYRYRVSARKKVGNLLYFSDGSYPVKCSNKPQTINVKLNIRFSHW